MKLIQDIIWLEVSDWEAAGVSYNTVKSCLSQELKSWRSITTSGKGREMLFRYDTLSMKHKALFAEAVRRFWAQVQAEAAQEGVLSVEERIREAVQPRSTDVMYFRKRGFSAKNAYKATLFARRAAWLRFLSEITSKQVRKNFAPLRLKEELLATCLPIIHAENCFNFRKSNLQYLKMRLVRWGKEGLDSCIDGRNGKQNALKVTQDVENLLLSILKTLEKPTAMMIWEVYNDFVAGRVPLTDTATGEVYNHKAYKPLSYSAVQRLVSKPINEALYDMVHGSNLTYREKHGRYLPRVRPNGFASQITCDDWDLPVDTTTGQYIKLYLFFDVATRYCMGYAWSWSKNTELFLNGLKNMMLNPTLNGYMPYELQTEKHLISALQESTIKNRDAMKQEQEHTPNPSQEGNKVSKRQQIADSMNRKRKRIFSNIYNKITLADGKLSEATVLAYIHQIQHLSIEKKARLNDYTNKELTIILNKLDVIAKKEALRKRKNLKIQ